MRPLFFIGMAPAQLQRKEKRAKPAHPAAPEEPAESAWSAAAMEE
jgi:hypothetical protein